MNSEGDESPTATAKEKNFNIDYLTRSPRIPRTLLASVQAELLAVEDMPHEMNAPRSSSPKQLNLLKERRKVSAIQCRLIQRRFPLVLLPVSTASLLISSSRPRCVGERVGFREQIEVVGIFCKR